MKSPRELILECPVLNYTEFKLSFTQTISKFDIIFDIELCQFININ